MAERVWRLCADLRFHVRRSYGTARLHGNAFATKPEADQVMASNPGLSPEAHRSLNFIVWRRSTLTKLCAVFCIHTLVSLLDIMSEHWRLWTLSAESCDGVRWRDGISYDEWRDEALDPKSGTERLVECSLVETWLGNNLTAMDTRTNLKIPLIGPKIRKYTMREDPKLSCAALVGAQGDACKSTFGLVTKEHTFDFTATGCPWPDLCKMPFKRVCPEQCASGLGGMCRDPGDLMKKGYPRFSAAFSKALYRSLQAQASRVSLVRRYLMAAMNLWGGYTLYLALTQWDLWAKSQRYLIKSWCLLFLAPFALSSVPIRLFLNMRALDPHIFAFTEVSSDYWRQDDYGARNWHKDCEDLRNPTEERIEYWHAVLDDLCRGCEDAGWSAPFKKSCYLWAAAKYTNGEKKLRWICGDFLDKGTNAKDKVLSAAKKLCAMSKLITSSGAADFEADPLGDMLLFSPQVAGGWEGVKTLMEIGVGIADAVAVFAVIAPAALSIAPGMIGASLFVKRLLPESSLPGVMIVLMPWLYTPMMWAFCNSIAQCNGDPFLATGLISICFAPMLYSGLGWSRSVVAPMNQERATEVLKSMALITNISILIGLICAAIGVKRTANQWRERADEIPEVLQNAREFVLKQVLDMWDLNTLSGVLFHIVFPSLAAVVSWYVKQTTIFAAAIDFIVQQITNQHQFDNMVMLKDNLQNEGMLEDMGVRSVINLAGEKDEQMSGMVELAKMR